MEQVGFDVWNESVVLIEWMGEARQLLSSSRDGRLFSHNRNGPKIGGCVPFGQAAYPSNTMWPGPRPISVLSGILIHPVVWSQQIWAENWGCAPFG